MTRRFLCYVSGQLIRVSEHAQQQVHGNKNTAISPKFTDVYQCTSVQMCTKLTELSAEALPTPYVILALVSRQDTNECCVKSGETDTDGFSYTYLRYR